MRLSSPVASLDCNTYLRALPSHTLQCPTRFLISLGRQPNFSWFFEAGHENPFGGVLQCFGKAADPAGAAARAGVLLFLCPAAVCDLHYT